MNKIPLQVLSAILLLLIVACKQPDQQATTSSTAKPDENRFTKVVLTEGMDEPMEMSFLDQGKIIIVERKGGVKIFDTKTNQIKLIATIPVNTKYTSKDGQVSEAEEGLMGVVAHPKFAENHWVYLYYADPVDTKHVLARWELKDDSLIASTKKILMEIPTQREVCCHTGGGMAFDADGNLYLTVGNNTANPASGTSNLDERPGRESWDDQRSDGNTNDLRGKILRIHPKDDGSYDVPNGNLFPKGMAKTRPEIFVMGNRNPWRVSVDSKTGFVYWGEVGPDASKDSSIGPRGYDEYNQARKAGFFGWPYFIGDNIPYAHFDYATNAVGAKFDSAHPVNESRNNTGLRELPPPQKAFIWYPYAQSDSFPLLGSSGRSATGGPVFRKADFANGKRPFPDYYEGKWLITDFMRGWIMSVSMDAEGNYKSMERFLPEENFSSAIDMKFGPEGDLYILEYGSAWFRGNANSALIRIEYNGGNRKPSITAKADKTAGAIPFTANLSSAGTSDPDEYDKNALKYEWKINSGSQVIKTIATADGSVTLDKPGNYQATLTVTDTKGASNSQTIELKAGNEPPVVSLDLLKGNKSFFFANQPLEYDIKVSDKEDGSIEDGKIQPSLVAVNFDYVPEGFDPIEIAQHHRAADDLAGFNAGQYLISNNDCKTCHMPDKKSVGPSYQDISLKYKTDPASVGRLAAKVISGGSGVWGEHAMAGHPNISQPDAEKMVKYILSTTVKQGTPNIRPGKGEYIPKVPAGENGNGGYLLRASYSDKGASGVGSLTTESVVALRNPNIAPEKADMTKGTQLLTTPSTSFSMVGNNSWIAFKDIDLTDIKQVDVLAQATPQSGSLGGVLEVRLDGPDGKLLGTTDTVQVKPMNFARFLENAGGKGKNNAKGGAKPVAANAGGAKKAQQRPRFDPGKFDFNLMRRMMASHNTVNIPATDGKHTLYIIAKNPNGGNDKVLMQLVEIQFKNTLAPPPPSPM